MLTLPEKYIILLLGDRGHFCSGVSINTAAIMLCELVLRKQLALVDNKLIAHTTSFTGDNLLDQLLTGINQRKKPGKIYQILEHSYSSSPQWYHSYRDRLIANGYLSQSKEKFLFFFSRNVYFPTPTGEKENPKEALRSIVLNFASCSDESSVLLQFALIANMHYVIFDRDERKRNKQRLKEILPVDPVLQKILTDQRAMLAAIEAAAS